jgi:RHS repeat-associated protein
VEYAFNDYGEKTALRTFRAGTGDFTTSAWPLSDDSDPKNPNAATWTSGDKTTWAYETATGLLTTKTDASAHAVAYTYNARGQLATRLWARNVTTTYAYSSTTAEQTGITYSDSTPALSYTYNRLGQSATVGDVTGSRTLLHCVCGKVTQETLDTAYFGGRILTYKLDTTGTGTLGRTVGYQLGVSGSPGLEADITYGYDATDRFNSLSMLGGPAYTYAYAANSNLIGSITDSASGWTETMSYNSTRDLLDSVDGQFSTAHKATFAYAYDTLGRRTSVVSSGEIFDRYSGAGLHSIYSYNDRSEVTAATGYTGQNVSDTSTASKLGGRDFGYSYDPIGNRVTSSVGSQSVAYTPNSLNQYTSRTVPASTYVTGLAPASATVTVNGGTASRLGDYFYGTASQANTSAPQWLLTTTASSLGGSVPRYVFLAQTPENYSYDLDGNLTADGRWAYAWDAENRLVSMETAAAAYTAGAPRQLLSFKYDYLGRRVRKTVANWNGSAYVATVDRKFIYDGWNLIAEYDALTTFTLVRSYLWGLDLTRTLQDGGGVGGLLAVIDATTSTIHQPYYDGNGNIHALVNRSTGAVTAAYEYSAFGETLRATGSFAQGNPFRFSSKYTDDESGLLYYGRRYYDPHLGRFVGRDPIEEKGGLHLYGFVGNNPISRWDYLGMDDPVMMPAFNAGARETTELLPDGCVLHTIWQKNDHPQFEGDEEIIVDQWPECPNTPTPTDNKTDAGSGVGGGSAAGNPPQAPNKPNCDGKLAAIANARQLLQHANGIFTDANAQFASDGKANENLFAAFSNNGFSNIQDARDLAEIAGQVVAEQMGRGAVQNLDATAGVTAAPFAAIQTIDGVRSIQNGDLWGLGDAGFGAATATTLVLKGATAGPRPLISPGSALAGGVTWAGNVSMVGTVGYWYFTYGTRLYYKNQNYKSSLQTVNAVGASLGAMAASYGKLLNEAKAEGCL